MASPPLLDFEALVAPIPGDNPAGDPVPFGVRQKLDAARKEEEPNPDDPTAETVERKADWPGIVRQIQEMLTGSSKDILLAARLTEALTKMHGLAGLRDGLHLLADLIDQCWDRIHPTPDEGEGMEVRAGPFHWMSDPDRGARFPNTIRNVPLVEIDDTRRSWFDWKRAGEGKGEITLDQFARGKPINEHLGDDLAAVMHELTRLESVLDAKFGREAPGLIGLRQGIEDCRGVVDHVLRLQAPTPGAEPAADGTAQPAEGAGGSVKPTGSREDAYRQIGQIANLLEQLEPHSPIPDLLRRVVELGRMPFRQLIRELVRDPNQLAEIRREFGIKEAAAAEVSGGA